jgi:hypothetical protein
MPLGDDLQRIIDAISNGQPPDKAAVLQTRLKLNALERLVALSNFVDPTTGRVSSLTAGLTEIGTAGIRLNDAAPDAIDEDATIKWLDGATGTPLATMGAYRNEAKTTATLDIYANSDHKVSPHYANGTLELAALSKGTTDDWSTWLFLYAVGDATGETTVADMNIGKAAAWAIPLKVVHNFTTRETLFVFDCSKAATGDPSGEEGMLYYNKTDNVLKMYCDGAWRTLASW